MEASEILAKTKLKVTTYLDEDSLPIVVGVADPRETRIGISIQRNFPLTLIERSYGIPFGRFRSNAVKLLSDQNELHGFKWSIETHEAVFEADAATDVRLQTGKQRHVPVRLSTGIGNVLQNLRCIAYVDGAPYMVVGERPDHPPPYACLVEYDLRHVQKWKGRQKLGLELLLFNELGGCQRVDKTAYVASPVNASGNAVLGYEQKIRWAVSGYPLVLNGSKVELELTTRNVSDFRHIWRLPKLQKSLVNHLADVSEIKEDGKHIEFYFGFDEIREKRNFVMATQDEPLTLPLELAMTQEWVETMCNVCLIPEGKLTELRLFNAKRHALVFEPAEVAADFEGTGYRRVGTRGEVTDRGSFYIDEERRELTVRLLPAIYPHHIVGIAGDGKVVSISICGQSGRSGITIEDAKDLCLDVGLVDALIFDNGNDVFARYEGRYSIAHKGNGRQTRLTAALHFADLLDPGPEGQCSVASGEVEVRRKSPVVAAASGAGSTPVLDPGPQDPSGSTGKRRSTRAKAAG